MVFFGTFIKVIDNSGVRVGKCIKVFGKSNKGGKIGDFILISVKKSKSFSTKHKRVKVSKGELFKGILVKFKKTICRYGGIFIFLKTSAIILIDSREMLLGDRITELVPFELRNFNKFRIIMLAPHIV